MKKSDSPTDKKKKIWIDLDNSPHVPFFKPILDDLHKRGYSTLLTARDCFQVCGLADLVHLKYKKIGRHYGKNVIMKVAGLLIRALQLMPTVMKEKPDLAVSHGSRSQVLIASILNIPTVVIADYEFTQTVAKPTYVIVPEMISDSAVKGYSKSFFKYPGIKEDVYVPDFKPDPSIYKELGISEGELIVTIRPPATEAHYHNPESELLFEATINFLGKQENTRMVILPRNEKKQTAWVKSNWSEWCDSRKIIFPEHVVDGLNLIWHSDLVISGGGTMNREAAALGVPVYSIFRGKIGAVDRYLSDNGRLILLETVEDVQTKILLNKRHRSDKLENSNRHALGKIVELIENILKERHQMNEKIIKLILVVGARPNFMKIAPLLLEIRKHNSTQKDGGIHIDYLLVHTGQHYDVRMSDAFFRDLNIPDPDVNLEVGSGSHAVQTAEIMVRFEKVCLQEKPDWVIVVGDVNSTMACTLVAAKLAIKVAHIEAGLRSFDRSMPEEINRLVTDALADLLFTPSEDADQNLLREGVSEDKIKRVGNIMIDTLMINLEKARALETL